jgi:hypothetical protein
VSRNNLLIFGLGRCAPKDYHAYAHHLMVSEQLHADDDQHHNQHGDDRDHHEPSHREEDLHGPGLFTGRQTGDSPLYVRHDERADRTVITAVSKAHMAMEVLTRLDLLTLEQIAGWDIEPTGNRVHQLIAGDREAINIPAAGKRIPRMRQRRDGGEQRCNNE